MFKRFSRTKSYDWLKEYKICHVTPQKLGAMVDKLSPAYYNVEEVSKEGFSEFVALMEEDECGPIILDTLLDMVNDEKNKNKYLTRKYYALKVIRHITHKHLIVKWKEHLELPAEHQRLETGAVLLAQWFQPQLSITENEISDDLDKIALKVIEGCPSSIKEKIEKGKSHELSPQQQRTVLETVNQVLYHDLGFAGNTTDYYNEKNSYINEVLSKKTGIPITLAIVYISVARRCGVLVEPVNFPNHFFIRWMEHPMATPECQYTFIDAYEEGTFLSQQELSTKFVSTDSDAAVFSSVCVSVPPMQVYMRMVRNLLMIGRQQTQSGGKLLSLRNAIELNLVLDPNDEDVLMLQARVNIHLNVDLSDVMENLQNAEIQMNRQALIGHLLEAARTQMLNYDSERMKKVKVKKRKNNENVEYGVGMVMKHRRYNYMCVIYGWDPICQASKEWIYQMGVNHLPKKDKQPFYNVLVNDGSSRYAAQENLDYPDELCVIEHPEVGKYFQEFTGAYYISNDEKLAEYPEDFEVVPKLVQRKAE